MVKVEETLRKEETGGVCGEGEGSQEGRDFREERNSDDEGGEGDVESKGGN